MCSNRQSFPFENKLCLSFHAILSGIIIVELCDKASTTNKTFWIEWWFGQQTSWRASQQIHLRIGLPTLSFIQRTKKVKWIKLYWDKHDLHATSSISSRMLILPQQCVDNYLSILCILQYFTVNDVSFLKSNKVSYPCTLLSQSWIHWILWRIVCNIKWCSWIDITQSTFPINF